MFFREEILEYEKKLMQLKADKVLDV